MTLTGVMLIQHQGLHPRSARSAGPRIEVQGDALAPQSLMILIRIIISNAAQPHRARAHGFGFRRELNARRETP